MTAALHSSTISSIVAFGARVYSTAAKPILLLIVLIAGKKDSSIDLIIHGQTHRYRNEKIGKVRIINPGECAGIIEGRNSVGSINLKDLKFERIFF